MQEVVIPLRRVGKDEPLGSPEDYMKCVQAEFAGKYLESLGIAATPANKANVMRYRPLEDCSVQGIWGDDSSVSSSSAIVKAIKILPPLRDKQKAGAGLAGVSRGFVEHWYGKSEPISVRAPARQNVWQSCKNEDDVESSQGGAACSPPLKAFTPVPDVPCGVEELKAEFQRATAARLAAAGDGSEALQGAERGRALKQELALLKARFVLPFASKRTVRSGRTEIYTWPAEGSLDMQVPEDASFEASRPICVTRQELRRFLSDWVRDSMPLELLTTRRDAKTFRKVRSVCENPEVVKLCGMLAHLTYWLTLSVNRGGGESRLTRDATQALSAGCKEAWRSFEDGLRENPAGVSLILPCLMLTLKVGMLHCFSTQYQYICQDPCMFQQIVDGINTVVMRLLDTNNTYPRFGAFEGLAQTVSLAKKVEHSQDFHTRVNGSKRFSTGTRVTSNSTQSALNSSADTVGHAGSTAAADRRASPRARGPPASAR